MRAAIALEDEALREAGAGDAGSKSIMAILREAGEKAVQKRLTPDLGREYLRRLVALSTGQQVRVWSVREWLNEWLNHKSSTAKPATLTRYRHSITAFLARIDNLADMPIDHLNIQNLREFRDTLHSEGRAAKTANGYAKDVGMALLAAVKEGLIQRSPSSNLQPLPEDDSVAREPFTMEEVGKLAKAAPSSDWKGVILLGAFGGLRIGDAVTLKAENVDLKTRIISFTPQKSSRRANSKIVLPMHPELLDFFKKHPLPQSTADPCFASLHNLTVGGHVGLSTTFAGIMAKAGVARGVGRAVEKGKAGRAVYPRSFHSLRHTFNSWMLNRGVAQETRQKIVGHADSETNTIYSHHEIETLRAAVEAVPGLSGEKKRGKARPKAGAAKAEVKKAGRREIDRIPVDVVPDVISHTSQHYTHVGKDAIEKAAASMPDLEEVSPPPSEAAEQKTQHGA